MEPFQRKGPEWDTPQDADGPVKISLIIGKDTLDRLDSIVKHGGFGGRGRALDSLLETLDDIVVQTRIFKESISRTGGGTEWTDTDSRALRSAVVAATLALTKFERFYGLTSPQGLVWQPPPG